MFQFSLYANLQDEAVKKKIGAIKFEVESLIANEFMDTFLLQI